MRRTKGISFDLYSGIISNLHNDKFSTLPPIHHTTPTIPRIMLVHTVFFWLKKELSADQVAQFRTGVERLKGINYAEAVYVGTPADTATRPVIDSSYDVCLTVILKDIPAHDAYQADPIHQEFIAQFKDSWDTVKVYDAD
ncbi:MAG: Dabb family protein [Opitutales bacterium]